MTNWIASTSGMNGSSVSSLLGLIVPFIMTFLGRQASALGGPSASSLTSLLTSQWPFLRSAAPSGLTSALGLGAWPDVSAASARVADTTREAAATGSSWLRWLLPLLALALLLLLLLRWCRPAVEERAAPAAIAPPAATAPGAVAGAITSIYGIDLGPLIVRTLPGGVELRVPEKGVEAELIGFIVDPGRPLSDDLWYSLDRVEFETGSAVLKPAAREQLQNLAVILKAYPNVSLKVGGYTDNVGDDAANQKLSQARAEATIKELTSLGVEANRLEAEGYGEQFPVASNETEQGRQRNRRVDVRVTKK